MRTHLENKEKMKKLEEEESKKLEWKAEEEKDIETLKNLAKKQGKWWFLHDIEEELGAEFKPLFRSIGQMKMEDKNDYLYVSRKIQLEASYPEIIKLFENLEKERGFSIEELKIRSSPNNPERHEASFTLSCVEIKKGFLSELTAMEGKEEEVPLFVDSLLLPPPWDEKQLLVLETEGIDPFVELEEVKKAVVPEGPVILPPIDISSKYRLEGIVSFPQYRIAIIGPDYILREGDWLDNMQITSINNHRITLMEGEQEYFMNIPGFATLGDKIKMEPTPEETEPTSEREETVDHLSENIPQDTIY
jgi:hypothetical protein